VRRVADQRRGRASLQRSAFAMQRNAAQCSAVQRNAVQCSAAQHFVMQYSATRCTAAQHVVAKCYTLQRLPSNTAWVARADRSRLCALPVCDGWIDEAAAARLRWQSASYRR
jgi:hypothetical protein